MELVSVELNVPKESKEVIDLLGQLFDQAKDGLDVGDISKLLPAFMMAVEGVAQIPAEAKGGNKDDLIAYLVKVIGSKFE